MKIVGTNIHFQKLEAKCSSPTFYQSYLEMIAAQELSEFLHMEIRFKYENEVLEFYKNGKVKTIKSKKDPQKTIQVINSTVGGTKVKLSQKKLGEKLHLPNSGVEIGRLPAKNLDWNIIGISGQAPSGPAKKADLNNDYKLVLELVIACLECGSGGHADDITQERAFIINALITKSKVNWAAHFFNSISKHLGKPNQKYLCQADQLLSWDQQLKNEKIIKECLGLPVNYCCEQILDVDWVWQRNYEDLHLEHLVTSPVSEFEADDEDPAVYRPIFSKATKDQENAASTPQAQNQEASEEELQQLLHSQASEILTTPCEITNPTETEIPEKSAENLEMSKPLEANEVQEEQAVEAERSSAEAEKETQMAELEASKSPVAIFQEQNEAEERDSLSRDISNFILGEAEEEFERTLRINDEEDMQEDAESLPMQLFQRTPSSHQKVQGLIESALASQHASFRQEIEQMEARYNKLIEKSEETHCSNLKEVSKSVDKTLEIISLLSNTVSNTMETYASDSYLQLKEVNKIREQIANVTVSLQKQMSLLQMDIRAALAVSSANQVVTKDYLKVIIDNQKEAHKLFRLLTTNSGNRKMEVVLQQHSPSLIQELPIAVKEGEVSYIPTHLNLTDLILDTQRSNPENSTQHLSSSGLDGTEAVGTIAAHFSNDNQTEERHNNIRRIKELCGNMQGIREIAGSSKRKKH
ncbi:unnamed protein product [Cuscuta campestris]|uniref:Uncharacterized protein n=1 Tax=Cuscuta campestris TaxID=132261 RepID=A0A484N3Z6_9ASTE|nr:unnamed protein product [Cuscuta campestris]